MFNEIATKSFPHHNERCQRHAHTHGGAHACDELTDTENDEIGRQCEDDSEDIHEEVTGEEHFLPSVSVGERREEKESDDDTNAEDGLRHLYVRVFVADQVPLLTRLYIYLLEQTREK